MNKYELTFHHLGLAVKHPEKAISLLEGLGYDIGPTVKDNLQNVNLVLCTSQSMPSIEVISETETAGPLASILSLKSSMIYHVCYETESLANSLDAIKRDNHRVIPISQPKPAVLFSGRHVSFYHIDGFGMIEILEMK